MKLLAKITATLALPLILLVIALWLIEDWVRGFLAGSLSRT